MHSFEEPGIEDVVVQGVIPLLSATPGRITNLDPTLGNATDDVIRDLLGITASEIQRLRPHKINMIDRVR